MGLYARSYDGLAGPQIPSIRGSNPDQVLVILDDMRLNNAQGGGFDLNIIPVEAIERIEIVRGGHSALLGTDAVGGAIHLISRETQAPRGFSYSVRSTLGSFGNRIYTFNGAHRLGSLSTFLTVNRTENEGNFTYSLPDSEEELTRENNDYQGDNIFFKANLDIQDKNRIQFLFQSLRSERGVIGSVSFPSPEARRTEKRRLFSIRSENQAAHRFRIIQNLYYNTYDNHYRNPGGWIPEDDLHENTSFGLDIQGQWNINSRFNAIIGTEYREDRLNSTKFADIKRTVQSITLQIEYSMPWTFMDLPSQWKWIPAIRWSRYSDVESKACPKLGMLLRVGEFNAFSIRGNIGQAYRVPSFNDLYWPEDDFTKGNPDLKPESSTNFDIGLEYSRRHALFLQVGSTYFHNQLENLILWEPDESFKWTPRNIGQTQIVGVENSISLRLPDNRIHLKIAYTWMEAVDKTDASANKGKRLIYRPDNKIDFSGGFRLGPVDANLNYRIVSKRYINPENTQSLPDYRLLNGNLGTTFTIRGLQIDAKLQGLNLLDKSVYLLDGYPLPGREWRFSVGFTY